MLKRVLILSLFLLGLTTGCHKSSPTNNGVPNVSVSFSVDLNNAIYNSLNPIGGWMYVQGGYDGIILYHQNQYTFLAFDRGCPYDCTTNTKAIVNVQANGISATCPVCGTTYVLAGGTITKGPGTIALKQYVTSFDGVSTVSVSN